MKFNECFFGETPPLSEFEGGQERKPITLTGGSVFSALTIGLFMGPPGQFQFVSISVDPGDGVILGGWQLETPGGVRWVTDGNDLQTLGLSGASNSDTRWGLGKFVAMFALPRHDGPRGSAFAQGHIYQPVAPPDFTQAQPNEKAKVFVQMSGFLTLPE